MTTINRAMVKSQLVRVQGQVRTVFRPVVLSLALTAEQKQVVARHTGRSVELLQLSKEDLMMVTGSAPVP